MIRSGLGEMFPENTRHSEDSIASSVSLLWRAKWVLMGVFVIGLLGTFALSQLIPDRYGVRSAYLPPAEGKVSSLLSEPLVDRDGKDRFVLDASSIFAIFTNAAQSSQVKRALYEQFTERSKPEDDYTFSAFLDAVQFTPPETRQGASDEIVVPAKLTVYAEDPELALWLGERYKALSEEQAIKILRADFESLRASVVTALRQSADKLRDDYDLESRQTLAALKERQALLEGVIALRRSGSEDLERSELSVMLNAEKANMAIPVYLLNDTTVKSALDVVGRQISQITDRENPDLYIEGLANVLSRAKAAQDVELRVSGESFYTEVLSPTVDEKLKSPKRAFLSVVGAIVITTFTMIVLLLAPLVRSER